MGTLGDQKRTERANKEFLVQKQGHSLSNEQPKSNTRPDSAGGLRNGHGEGPHSFSTSSEERVGIGHQALQKCSERLVENDQQNREANRSNRGGQKHEREGGKELDIEERTSGQGRYGADYYMWCQMRNEWTQKKCTMEIQKRHVQRTKVKDATTSPSSQGASEDMNQGVSHRFRSKPTEATSERFRTRAHNNHDVLDHEFVDHAEKMIEVGISRDETEDEDDYPWYAPMVICYWFMERMRRDNTLYWNVDGYDGKISYVEEGFTARLEFGSDAEMTAEEYKQVRQDLIVGRDERRWDAWCDQPREKDIIE